MSIQEESVWATSTRRCRALLLAMGWACALGLVSLSVRAQSTSNVGQGSLPPEPRVHWMRLKPAVLDLSVQFGAAHMNPLTAASEGISEYGGGLAFRAALSVFDVVSFSALTGLLAVNDRRTYTEQVVSEGSPNGKPQSRESIIEIGRHALALGPRTPPLCLDKHGDRCIAIAAFAEYGKVWVNGARKIQDCVNCTEQSLHLRDGQFVALGVDVGQRPNDGPSGMLVSATYRHTWPRVGLAQELLLGLEIAF